MRQILPGLIVGLLFGAGLALSDMINPARVLAFLDIAGDWDPTLAFVMGGALLPSALGYAIVRRMRRPVMAEEFCIPQNRTLDRNLLAGAALFGAGWGLVGLCPGPALAGLLFGAWQVWLFTTAMLVGMFLHRLAAAPRPALARRSLPDKAMS
ncbi:MAG: YeeE/YedE family protein [Allosphingosinicella sp.]